MATARTFAPISIEELKAKIDAIEGDEGAHALIDHLGSDIKVKFDLENVSDSAKDFGPKVLLGYHSEANGFTYCGMCAGGDWEHPVFFVVYWDGKKLRGYVPTEGNPWNTTTKCAYGNDEKKDALNAKKRWPDKYDGSEVESDDFDFDVEELKEDIFTRILPAGGAKAVRRPAVRQPHQSIPRPGIQPLPIQPTVPVVLAQPFVTKSLQERVESATYYGDDEGLELFQATCSLAYRLFGLGSNGKAEVACAWAEEMAYESKHWAEQHGEDLVSEHKGNWGY